MEAVAVRHPQRKLTIHLARIRAQAPQRHYFATPLGCLNTRLVLASPTSLSTLTITHPLDLTTLLCASAGHAG